MPLPGIYASSFKASNAQGAYDALASVTLTANTASVVFSGIPSGYQHLQVRAMTRDTQTNTNINSLYMAINGDTAANYAWHRTEGFGSGTPSAGGAASTGGGVWLGPNSTNGYGSNIFAVHIIDILDYASTSKYKVTRHLGGFDTNGTGTEPGEMNITSGLWMNTAPVTSLTFYNSSYNQVAYSSYALYGIK